MPRFSVRSIVSALSILIALPLGVSSSAMAESGRLPRQSGGGASKHIGNDISWPQCPVDSRHANPMPAPSSSFVIIGLTRGLPFTKNPCLKEQFVWSRNRGMRIQFYTMAAYPKAAQLAAYRKAGPFRGGTTLDALRNVGWNEAVYGINYLRSIGVTRPGTIWIDIESRSRQPWPRNRATYNRAVIEGIVYALRRHRIGTGFYANSSDWQRILANWQRPTIPFWATVGPRGRATAAAQCGRRSFSGGKIWLAQWWDTGRKPRDWNIKCR